MANSHRAGDEAPETIPQVGHIEPGRSRERLRSPKETGSLEKKKKPTCYNLTKLIGYPNNIYIQ